MPTYRRRLSPQFGGPITIQGITPPTLTSAQQDAWDNFVCATDRLVGVFDNTPQPSRDETKPTPEPDSFTEAVQEVKDILLEAKELATKHATGFALDVLTDLAKIIRDKDRKR